MASHYVIIKHPGYEPPQDKLIDFPACEGPAFDQAYYPTIIVACRIITQNVDNVWLQNEDTGVRFDPEPNDLIPAGVYCLRIADMPPGTQYPIVPSWVAWKFPYRDLPPNWQAMSDLDMIFNPEVVSGEHCRIGNKKLALEIAHIIPKIEIDWFIRNGMDQYAITSGRTGNIIIDSTVNKMRLQAHVHKLWDESDFCIVPRMRWLGEGQKEMKWTTQVLRYDPELQTDWHDRTLLPLTGRSVEYLYARFAWHIFPKLLGFIITAPRILSVAQMKGQVVNRLHSRAECLTFAKGQGNSRNNSPKKRDHSLMEGEFVNDDLDDDYCASSGGDDTGNDTDNDTGNETADGEPIPTRPKLHKRQRSSAERIPPWEFYEVEELRGRELTRV